MLSKLRGGCPSNTKQARAKCKNHSNAIWSVHPPSARTKEHNGCGYNNTQSASLVMWVTNCRNYSGESSNIRKRFGSTEHPLFFPVSYKLGNCDFTGPVFYTLLRPH